MLSHKALAGVSFFFFFFPSKHFVFNMKAMKGKSFGVIEKALVAMRIDLDPILDS